MYHLNITDFKTTHNSGNYATRADLECGRGGSCVIR
jgi:hypothetical protein